MHGLGFGFPWLDKAQRLRNRHLVDHDLARSQRQLRDAVTGLDTVASAVCVVVATLAVLAKNWRIDTALVVSCALVYHLKHIVCTAQNTRRHLDAACAPTIRQWHFAALATLGSQGWQRL